MILFWLKFLKNFFITDFDEIVFKTLSHIHIMINIKNIHFEFERIVKKKKKYKKYIFSSFLICYKRYNKKYSKKYFNDIESKISCINYFH